MTGLQDVGRVSSDQPSQVQSETDEIGGFMYVLSRYYLLQLTRWEISPWAVTLSVSQTILFIGYVLISLRNSDAASMNISNPVYVLSPLPFYSISISASPICGA